MRIAVISQWFTDGLGYSENLLPAALARVGHEVHVVAGQGNVYSHTPKYEAVYRPLFGNEDVPTGTYELADGVILHRVNSVVNTPQPGAVMACLQGVRPDVVQTFAIVDSWSLASAEYCVSARVPLFTENHVHESVIPRGLWQTPRGALVGLANRVRSKATDINRETRQCFAISEDTARVAIRRFGVPRSKVVIESLGVDTSIFFPDQDLRSALSPGWRSSLGIDQTEVICLYTGRLSADKAPDILAQAVQMLRGQGLPFRAVIIGAGSDTDRRLLESRDGTIVLDFRPFSELANFYRLADIGVWPREESTSQLDAMACGLPLVVSDQVKAAERLGVGAVYSEGSPESLARSLTCLLDPDTRHHLGSIAAERVARDLSWESVARRRLRYYSNFVN